MKRVFCLVVTLVMLLTVILPVSMTADEQSATQVITSGQYGKGNRGK